ncbi:Uncharacterised protein [Burkholderia pseudomallei]|nr:Uncharacterised protein [Burkholderia pseudomallei]CAJ7178365.1 Uncharacterised protein [Burkholderia pseudomallei]VCE37050.1 Uncharacterised protein [Burkholderia pseudomallei]
MAPKARVAPREHRAALRAVAELVRIGRDRRDARQTKIECRNIRIAQRFAPRQHPAAEAPVDVQPHVLFNGDRRQRTDRIDRAVRIIACRAHEHHRIRVHRVAHEIGIDLHRDGIDRRDGHVEAEQMRGLAKHRMRGRRPDHPRPLDAALGARFLAIRKRRAQDALGAAERDHAARALPGVVRGHRIAVQHRNRHADDLAFHPVHARAHVAPQCVDVTEDRIRFVQPCMMVAIAGIHRARAMPALPVAILALGHRAQLREQFVARRSLFREAAHHAEFLRIRIQPPDAFLQIHDVLLRRADVGRHAYVGSNVAGVRLHEIDEAGDAHRRRSRKNISDDD